MPSGSRKDHAVTDLPLASSFHQRSPLCDKFWDPGCSLGIIRPMSREGLKSPRCQDDMCSTLSTCGQLTGLGICNRSRTGMFTSDCTHMVKAIQHHLFDWSGLGSILQGFQRTCLANFLQSPQAAFFPGTVGRIRRFPGAFI